MGGRHPRRTIFVRHPEVFVVARSASVKWTCGSSFGTCVPDSSSLKQRRNSRPLGFRTDAAAYFLGRDDIIVSSPRGMARWRKRLFLFLARNAEFAGAHFGIPPERIIELGGQVQI